mmetsp:Transcript_100970/g.290405  ORF Transcript_100970/g.290405 Transcript_100970/m.290405 type:complete len:308 (+) Transcript_100970:991-1914(+)
MRALELPYVWREPRPEEVGVFNLPRQAGLHHGNLQGRPGRAAGAARVGRQEARLGAPGRADGRGPRVPAPAAAGLFGRQGHRHVHGQLRRLGRRPGQARLQDQRASVRLVRRGGLCSQRHEPLRALRLHYARRGQSVRRLQRQGDLHRGHVRGPSSADQGGAAGRGADLPPVRQVRRAHRRGVLRCQPGQRARDLLRRLEGARPGLRLVRRHGVHQQERELVRRLRLRRQRRRPRLRRLLRERRLACGHVRGRQGDHRASADCQRAFHYNGLRLEEGGRGGALHPVRRRGLAWGRDVHSGLRVQDDV